ncbi:MAG: hypothetical protein HC927_09140 [Deltaproteobacteria bacterium]|nr:hypothetical protein [Deltaproteobacteria bacterium]
MGSPLGYIHGGVPESSGGAASAAPLKRENPSHSPERLGRRETMVRATFALISAAALGGAAFGFTLNDRNASVTFDAFGPGQSSFIVDGVDQLAFQGFAISIGGVVTDLSSVAYSSAATSGVDFDPGDERFIASQSFGGFRIDYRFTLSGGLPGSNVANLAIFVDVVNVGSAPAAFRFFQFADFDLNDTALDSSIDFTAPG